MRWILDKVAGVVGLAIGVVAALLMFAAAGLILSLVSGGEWIAQMYDDEGPPA